MNNVQEKENNYNAATMAVEKQREIVTKTASQITELQNTYLQSVVRAAMLSEKARRRKDKIVNITFLCSFIGAAIIIMLINVYVGVVFSGAIGCIMWATREQRNNEEKVCYNNRKAFFSKYAHVIPVNEQLKWKNVSNTEPQTVTSPEQGKEWTCPSCSAKNSAHSSYCTSCGRKKV